MTTFPQFSSDPSIDSADYTSVRDQLTAAFENFQLYQGRSTGTIFYYDSAGLNIDFGYNITANLQINPATGNSVAYDALKAAGLLFSSNQWSAIVVAAQISSSSYANASASALLSLAAPLNLKIVSIAAADALANPSAPAVPPPLISLKPIR